MWKLKHTMKCPFLLFSKKSKGKKFKVSQKYLKTKMGTNIQKPMGSCKSSESEVHSYNHLFQETSSKISNLTLCL